MSEYLLVNGNFVPTNGMDMPNLALARYLAGRGDEVHLVTHRADSELLRRPNVKVHYVPKPAGSYLLAAPVLDRIGLRWAAKVTGRAGRVLVNGGNCRWGDINWVHYVHASYRAPRAGGPLRVLKNECARHAFGAYERAALGRARIVIVNSERTRRDVVEHLGVKDERVHTVYYGIDSKRFCPPTVDERAQARAMLGWSDERPVVAFIGALGDRRKGLDKLFAAWQLLCADPHWDANLAVVGTGAELSAWKARAVAANLDTRIIFMGFRRDVPLILSACDSLVAPTRYEAYGQSVHEALCCGLPALVSREAGVAERYPAELQDLLISDPEDVSELVERLRAWRSRAAEYRAAVAALSAKLRTHTWDDMAALITRAAEMGA